MSKNATLQAEKRDGTGKGVARKLRQSGRVPAVLYGGGEGSMHLSLDTKKAEYLFHNISVDNTIIDLAFEGEKEPVRTLVREIQTHPWKAHVMHVDFLRIQKGVAVEMTVPVRLVGMPIGVRNSGGIIEQIIHDIAVRCIPSKIPESIEVDITELDLHDVLHVGDITFGEGVEVMLAPEQTICAIAQPRAEEVVAPEETEGEGEGAADEDAEGAAEGDES